MKYKSKDYAVVLSTILANSKADNKKITENFLKLLEKNGDSKKIREILLLTEKLFLQKTGAKKIIIETARKGKGQNFKELFGDKNTIIKEKINPEIIAGLKIMVNGEKQLDFSLKNKLDVMFT